MKKFWIILLSLAIVISLSAIVWAETVSVENCTGECAHEAAFNRYHYDTLEEALVAAKSAGGGEVDFLKDVIRKTPIVLSNEGEYIIDGNGYKMSIDINGNFSEYNVILGDSTWNTSSWTDVDINRLTTHKYTLKNMVFDDQDRKVIEIYGGAVVIEGCVFDNINSTTIYSLNRCTDVTIDGCTFANSTGFSVYLQSACAESKFEVKNTLVTKCTARESTCAIVYFVGSAEFKVTNCTFTENQVIPTANRGGVLYTDATKVSGSVFQNNEVSASGDRAGVVIIESGEITETVFSGNTLASSNAAPFIATVVHKGDGNDLILNKNYWDGAVPAEGTAYENAKPANANTFTVDSYYINYTNGELSGLKLLNPVAKNDEVEYATLEEAVAAAEAGDTITLVKDVVLEEILKIEKTLTIVGAEKADGMYSITGNGKNSSGTYKTLEVHADLTLENVEVINNKNYGRPVDMRNDGITLNVIDAKLTATSAGNNQLITVGGNGVGADGVAGKTVVNVSGSQLTAGKAGYGIIAFNPVEINIADASVSTGYNAVYMKGISNSLGSAGSVINVKGSTLETFNNSEDVNSGAFGLLVTEDKNITFNVDSSSSLTVEAQGAVKQFIIMNKAGGSSNVNIAPCTWILRSANGNAMLINDKSDLAGDILLPNGDATKYQLRRCGYDYMEISEDQILVIVGHEHTNDPENDIFAHEVKEADAKAPTCTDAGWEAYEYCTVCDYTSKVEIPAQGHKVAFVEYKEKTCTEDGIRDHWFCEVCSEVFGDEEATKPWEPEDVIIPAGHRYVPVAAKGATCTEDGNVEYYACKCGYMVVIEGEALKEVTSKDVTIPAKGHTMTKVETKTPSCTDDGNVEYYSCSVCKKNFADEKGEKELATVVETAKGHKLTKVEAKAATCTAAGNIEHYSCDGCKKLFTDAEGKTGTTAEKVAVAAKDHTEVAVAGKAATCTETGLTEGKKCSVCGTVTVAQKTIDALGHKLTKVEAKAATYAEAGNIEHYACACGKLFADAEGKKEITDVVIPQLIKVEEEKAEVSKDAVDNALADAKEKAEETGKPVEVVIEVPKAPVVEKPEEGETPDTPEEKPEEKPQEVVKVELPVQALEDVAKEEATLTVVMPSVTVTVDTDALKAVTEQAAGNTVSLVVEQVKEENLTQKQQEAVKKYDVAVTIKAEFICQETNEKIWTEDNNAEKQTGSVTVKMPFTPAEGSKGSDYKVLYIADDGSVKEIETAFEDGHLVFALEHFSEYVVVNTTKTSDIPNSGDSAMLTPFALLLALSFAGMAVMVAGKKELL